jgi:hypothetical protein
MGLTIGRSNQQNVRVKSMARRPRGDEKIKMDTKRFGYFPQRFTWRGRRYYVQAVERTWTVTRKRLGNKVARHCFRVRCAAVKGQGSSRNRALSEGTLIVYQDLNSGTWYLEKVVSKA